MRRYYPKPHFLPESCEIPSKEYVFMGYDDGATMHVSADSL
jgi:predicted esterase